MNIEFELPVASSAFVSGPSLKMLPSRSWRISFEVEMDETDEIRKIDMIFEGVRAISCTYEGAYNQDAYLAYDKLVSFDESSWCTEISANLRTFGEPTDRIKHFAVLFDDGLFIEAVAEGCVVVKHET